MNDLQAEISVNPVPYISLLGLDAANNKIHAMIWKSFAINRSSERPVLYYKLINSDHKFPPSKNRKIYDRYVPNGIIKKKWLNKHLFEIPSVVAIFEQIDWNTLKHDNVRSKLIERINSLKLNLNGRQIKIVLILLQSDPVPINDDSSYKVQATKLCEECDISPKSLFIIPINDESAIPGYVLRIELVINELAKNHYAAKVKMIKSHKDQLNKSLQNYLFIRHEFKLGFYHEIRQIYNVALGHYKNSYASLMEIRVSSLNILEIKNVAGLLNYKIIRLCFYLNIPLDAISNFKKHIDIFQNKFISKQIEFEHYAWLSKQFFMFAELFDMAINMFHLSPSTTQNPGIYFFESAMYTIKRRQSARLINNQKLSLEETKFISEILSKQDNVEFIGQLPWIKNDTYSEYITEEMEFKIFQYTEQLVDLTPFLINLYINVLNQIKKFKKPRFMRFVMSLIGEEYYNISNYNDALNYFCNILTFYREERWKSLHQKITNLALNSAYLSIDYTNFIKCGFELISNELVTKQEKSQLIDCLLSYLNLEYKSFELEKYVLKSMKNEWTRKLNEMSQNSVFPSEIFINVDHEINFLKCKVFFSSKHYTIEDELDITVLIFSQLPVDLTNIDLQIKFENPHLDKHCSIVNDMEYILKADSLNFFQFKLKPLCKILESFEKIIKIIEVAFIIKSKVSTRFQWSFSQNNILIPIQEKHNDSIKFNKIDNLTIADILQLESKLDIEIKHNKDLFLNENALIELKITSKERHPISNLRLSSKLMTNMNEENGNTHEWLIFQNNILEKAEENYLIVDKLEPEETSIIELVLRALSTGNKVLLLNFTYDLLVKGDKQFKPITANKNCSHPINIIEPFMFSSKVSNYADPDTANIRVNEPFRLGVQLKSVSDDDIEIHSMEPQFANTLTILSKKSYEFPLLSSRDSSLNDIYLVKCSIESPIYSLGSWVITWTRKENNFDSKKTHILSESIFSLPSIMISPSIIYVELYLPEKVYARNPFMAKYKIYSRLDVDVVIEISIGNAEYFMIAGNRQIKVNLQSKLPIEQLFIFFPLICGQLLLPKLDISVHPNGQNPIKIDYINQMAPSTIFVLPKLRTNINL